MKWPGRIKRFQATIVSRQARRSKRSLETDLRKDPGTFQQYALAPANYVTPIPDGLKSEDAAPLLCAGVTT